MGAFIDRTAQRFGRLVVLERAPKNPHYKSVMWLCRCDCGNITVVNSYDLGAGNIQSCGCLQRETTSKTFKKHGMSGIGAPPEYQVWLCMKNRCVNANHKHYRHYGGRGITVCEEWRDSFEQFYNDMGPRPGPEYKLERIDNDKGYFKENCRWATQQEQCNNTRRTIRVMIENDRMSLKQAAERLGLNYKTIYWRFSNYGVLPEGVMAA